MRQSEIERDKPNEVNESKSHKQTGNHMPFFTISSHT